MKFLSREQWLYLGNILVSRWVNSGKDITRYVPDSILCVKWDEIGDMAACTHVFSLLKKRFPNAELHVLTKPYSAALIENHPDVDKVLTSLKEWNKKYNLLVELRGTRKTLWKTFRYYPTVRLDRGMVRMRHKGNQLHETRTNFEIIQPILGNIPFEKPALFPSEKNILNADYFISQNQLKKFAIIHAGARRELRRWGPKGFAEVCNDIFKNKNLQLVFVGTPDEEKQISKITDLLDVPFVKCTQNFGIMDLAALMKKADLFLGNESGPLQLADVMEVPLVGLFGPGVKNVFYPQHPRSAIIHHVLSCNPCDQIHCVHPSDSCMKMIQTQEVVAAMNSVLIK